MKTKTNELKKGSLLLILIIVLTNTLSCKRNYEKPINTTKELQTNLYFKKYVESFVEFSESITKDEWGLTNPTIKQQWAEAKMNNTLESFTKRLLNKKGESYYSKRLKVLQAYTNVYLHLIKPGIITKKMFDQTFSVSIKYVITQKVKL